MGIDRRGFLKSTASGVAAVGLGAVGCVTPGAEVEVVEDGESPFRHGVASGDPLADRVILWTRVTPERGRIGEPISIKWWIEAVAGGEALEGVTEARPDRDYTVKVDVDGLAPGSRYRFGFETERHVSPLGVTRTLPSGDVDRFRLAFASCANYPAGFFNAYANLAEREDIDVVLHLGDYLYEYENGRFGDGTAIGRIPEPDRELLTLDDYRRRHACYKTDPDLQAAHQAHPWITIWDDHESANNAHLRGAKNHSPETEGDWGARRLAAIRAYYEWMPIRELPTGIFRRFEIGSLLDLLMLDARLHARDPQPPRDPAIAEDPHRTMLGADQTQWLLDALSASQQRAQAWRVVGQQVVLSPQTHRPERFNPDSWDGYRANRRQLLGHLEREEIENVVFLTGDVHSTWVFDVPGTEPARYDPRTGEGAVAVEFTTPAVSSRPAGQNPKRAMRLEEIRADTPHLVHADLEHQGFAILEVTPERVRAEYVYTGPVDQRSAKARRASVFEVTAGRSHVVRIEDGAARIAPS